MPNSDFTSKRSRKPSPFAVGASVCFGPFRSAGGATSADLKVGAGSKPCGEREPARGRRADGDGSRDDPAVDRPTGLHGFVTRSLLCAVAAHLGGTCRVGAATARPFFVYYFPGVYQMGELHARSWIVAGTSSSSGRLFRTAS